MSETQFPSILLKVESEVNKIRRLDQGSANNFVKKKRRMNIFRL